MPSSLLLYIYSIYKSEKIGNTFQKKSKEIS